MTIIRITGMNEKEIYDSLDLAILNIMDDADFGSVILSMNNHTYKYLTKMIPSCLTDSSKYDHIKGIGCKCYVDDNLDYGKIKIEATE